MRGVCQLEATSVGSELHTFVQKGRGLIYSNSLGSATKEFSFAFESAFAQMHEATSPIYPTPLPLRSCILPMSAEDYVSLADNRRHRHSDPLRIWGTNPLLTPRRYPTPLPFFSRQNYGRQHPYRRGKSRGLKKPPKQRKEKQSEG